MSAGLRREFAAATAATLAGAAALFAATAQDWAVGAVELPGRLAPAPVVLSAASASPTAAAMGWAAVAAVAALAATRGWARRGVGALLAVFGALAAVDVWRGTRPPHLESLAAAQTTADGTVSGLDTAAGWPLLAAAGGALLLVAGLLTVARGARWPAMGSRYDRPGSRRTARPDDPVDLWRSLDNGADPTLEPAEPAAPVPEQPVPTARGAQSPAAPRAASGTGHRPEPETDTKET